MNDVEKTIQRDAAKCNPDRWTRLFVWTTTFICGSIVFVISVISLKEADGNHNTPAVTAVLWVIFLAIGLLFILFGLNGLAKAILYPTDMATSQRYNQARIYLDLDELAQLDSDDNDTF